MRDDDDRVKKAKDQWENIDPKQKESMEVDYKKELEAFKVDFAVWKKKYNVSDEDAKRKTKNKKRDDTDEEENKPTRTKGTKQTKQAKEA